MPSVKILKYIKQILTVIYSKETASEVFGDLKNLMDVYGRAEVVKEKRKKYNDRVLLNEKDAVLITYPDTIYEEREKPIVTLLHFLKKHVRGVVTGVHLLPFFPSSSDGGYAVINVSDDTIKLPEYRGKIDLITHISFDGKVAPYGVYFLK